MPCSKGCPTAFPARRGSTQERFEAFCLLLLVCYMPLACCLPAAVQLTWRGTGRAETPETRQLSARSDLRGAGLDGAAAAAHSLTSAVQQKKAKRSTRPTR